MIAANIGIAFLFFVAILLERRLRYLEAEIKALKAERHPGTDPGDGGET
jgi:hypothetical protein